MNIAAELTLKSLRSHYRAAGPYYRDALVTACCKAPPPFGTKNYEKIYRDVARDPNWMALSLIQNAQGEGEGSEHLWDLAASTPDAHVAAQIKAHAIDESRHAKAYVAMLDITFPDVVDNESRAQLVSLSPGYTQRSPLEAHASSPYASAITLDDLIQMNIAEIRTRMQHLFQRPVLLAYCRRDRRARVRRILDSLLLDETRHIAYTARLIERAARESGAAPVVDLMKQRLRDFNQLTDDEIAGRALVAA